MSKSLQVTITNLRLLYENESLRNICQYGTTFRTDEPSVQKNLAYGGPFEDSSVQNSFPRGKLCCTEGCAYGRNVGTAPSHREYASVLVVAEDRFTDDWPDWNL